MSQTRSHHHHNPLEQVGHPMINFLSHFGRFVQLFFDSARSVWQGTIFWKNTFVQMELIGVKSLPIVLIIAGFTGMVFSLQIAKIFAAFGLSYQLGQILSLTFARELAPVLMGVVVAGRVGSSIAAEIGSMKVTEQVEALEALSTDPIDYLVAPRIIAAAFTLPILVIFADLFGIGCGFILAILLAGIQGRDIIDGVLTFVVFWDFAGGIIKAFFFGMVIAGVGCYKGLHTENGAVGVGKSTIESVVLSMIIIFILNYFLSMILYNL
jgi:phospholipid/cholesterol/gamma-HCH transport system permease protein